MDFFDFKRYLWIINLLFSILLSFYLSQITKNEIVKHFELIQLKDNFHPLSENSTFEQPKDQLSYLSILERNIFDSENRPLAIQNQAEEKKEPTLDLFSPPIKSDISAKLVGTIIRSDSKYSVAFINSGGITRIYRLYESIVGEAMIILIQRGRVEFIRNFRREYIESSTSQNKEESVFFKPPPTDEEKGEIKQVDDNLFVVDKTRFDASLKKLNQVLYDAASIPNVVDGRIKGYRILAIRQGSIFEQLGIRDNDVIMAVNAKEIDSLNTVMLLFQTLQKEARFNITIDRNGDVRNFQYVVK